MKKGKLQSNRPDVGLANRIIAIFKDDPEVKSEFNIARGGKCSKLILNVNNSKKASAIRKLLLPVYNQETFDISLPLEVEVKDASEMCGDVIIDAFSGNPHFKEYIEIPDPFTGEEFHVCIFKNEVIQFENDNAASLHGFEFRLMQDLCKEVADIPKLIYTTDDGIEDESN